MEVQDLTKANAALSNQIKGVAQQVKTLTTEKNAQQARDLYPGLLGDRVAQSAADGAVIDPSKKDRQDIYVGLNLWTRSGQQSKLDAKQFAQVMTVLREHTYTVFEGGVNLVATSGRSSATLGVAISNSSCLLAKLDPPCILYFREPLRAKVNEIRDLIRVAQIVPSDRIKFVDPRTLDAGMQELIRKSGIDITVVLSGEAPPGSQPN
jgi:hypothetical protein